MSKKLAVIGANGNAGKLIVEEALNQGFDVTAIVRSENKSKATNVIKKDLYDLTKEDLKDFDVVVTATSPWTVGRNDSLEFLSNLLSNTDTRFVIMGGAGSLYTDESLTTQCYQTPEFNPEFLPTATAMAGELATLRTRNDVKWTYISPAQILEFDAPKTGEYEFHGEVSAVNSKGESFLSYADFALALIDEVKNANNIQKRISVIGK